MTIDKLDPVWAESGDTGTPPTDEKIEVGWFDERPKMERFNWLQERVESIINELVLGSNRHDALGSLSPDTTELQALLHYNRGDKELLWHGATGAINRYAGGGGEVFVDIFPGWNYTDGVPCVYAVDVGDNTQIWELTRNTDDNEVTATARSLGTTLSSVSESIYGICCDGPTVYLLTAPVSGAAKIHAYTANTWPTTPAELWNNDLAPSTVDTSNYDRNKIILADATRLATLNGGQTGAQRLNVCLKADGTSIINGQGSGPTGEEPTGALCSDGTNLFFVTKDNGGTEYSSLCAAKISDLTTPTTPAAAFVPNDCVAATQYADCVFDGTHIWYVRDDSELIAYDIANDSYIQNTTTPGSFAQAIARATGDYSYLAFDGLCLNVVCSKSDGVITSRFAQRGALQPAAAGLNLAITGGENQAIEQTGSGASIDVGRMVYSNGFLWMISTQASDTIICTPVAGQIGSTA
jgi:hypothetical protein